MTPGYSEFEFDLPGALLTSLVKAFETMLGAPLRASEVDAIPDAQGVYQIFLDGKLSYIGKTDAEMGLRRRLQRHARKIQHRVGLDSARLTFRAIRVFVFTAIDLETQLIGHYNVETWNGSGFGSNDPGRERDTTKYKENHFDALFPIDIDRNLPPLVPNGKTAADYFSCLRDEIPYTFRAETFGARKRQPHPDLANANVAIPAGTANTARGILTAIVGQLPSGWQATKLPSHLILYKERKEYPSGVILERS